MGGKIAARVAEDNTERIIAHMGSGLDRVVGRTVAEIERGMVRDVPVDTGTAQRSIGSTKVGPAHWFIRVGVDYGIYIEYGTIHTPPQPFVTPNVERARQAFYVDISSLRGAT